MTRTLSLLAAAALTCVGGAILAQALDRATRGPEWPPLAIRDCKAEPGGPIRCEVTRARR